MKKLVMTVAVLGCAASIVSAQVTSVNIVGYNYIKNDTKKALSYFKLNVKNYPKSSNAFDSLGEVYMLLGDKKNALKNYQESFRLNPRNDNAQEMILKLQSN